MTPTDPMTPIDHLPTLLLVDDEATNLQVLRQILQADYRLLYAKDGAKALELAQANPVDLVLLDIMMPEMDGYDTMRAIRRIPKFKSLPIITLTAKAMKGDRDKCIAAGASDYITKPVDVAQLLSLMRVWLH